MSALADEVREAVRAEMDAIVTAMRPAIADELRRVLDERNEKIEPLAAILGIATDSALKREKRDPGLKALAVCKVGRQRRYRRASVMAYLAAKVKP